MKREVARLIILAFYNKSVEEDHLRLYDNSIISLENALVLSENIFGLNDQLSLQIAKEYVKSKEVLIEKIELLKKSTELDRPEVKYKREIGLMNLDIKKLRSIINLIPNQIRGTPLNSENSLYEIEHNGDVLSVLSHKEIQIALSCNNSESISQRTDKKIPRSFDELPKVQLTQSQLQLLKQRTEENISFTVLEHPSESNNSSSTSRTVIKKAIKKYRDPIIIIQAFFRMLFERDRFRVRKAMLIDKDPFLFVNAVVVRIHPKVNNITGKRIRIASYLDYRSGYLRMVLVTMRGSGLESSHLILRTSDLQLNDCRQFDSIYRAKKEAEEIAQRYLKTIYITEEKLEFDSSKKIDTILEEIFEDNDELEPLTVQSPNSKDDNLANLNFDSLTSRSRATPRSDSSDSKGI